VQRFLAASRRRAETAKPLLRDKHFYDAFFGCYAARPYWERHTRSLAYALEQEPVCLFPDEHLVGMIYQAGEKPTGSRYDADAWDAYCPHSQAIRRSEQAKIDPTVGGGGAPGHIGWRWDWLLRDGVMGHMRRIRGLLNQTQDRRARRLYRGALIMWRSALRWNDKHVAALRERLTAANDPGERRRLRELVRICARVPKYPARNFREAVQAFHMQHLMLMFENPYGGNGPGRVDYFLWPHLERDMADGKVTARTAKDLIDELWIRFEERLYPWDGWVEAVTLGGSHADGRSAVNPLSAVMIQSIATLRQTHPGVYARVGGSTPDSFVDLCVHYLIAGENRRKYLPHRSLVSLGLNPNPKKSNSIWL